MNLPKLPFLEKKQKSEYFLSLVLRDEKASAVVFKEAAGRVDVVGEHNEIFKAGLENATEEELLNVIDRAVSIAEKTLPEGEESQKTIFGLKNDWVEDGKIKPEYLAKLKKVSDELQFKPMGFLVITEAIIHYLEREEGAPVSAIVVEVGKKSITVSLTKAGKILETKSTPLEGSVPMSVDALLKHFTTAEVLPSRIVIFDSGSEKLAQDFMGHKWSRELGFLHIPKITNLDSNYDAKAVLSGAATQMGFEVLAASLVHAVKEDAGQIEHVESGLDIEDKTLGEAASEFGFTSVDLAEKPKTAVDESVEKTVKSDNITVADQFKEIPEEVKIENSDQRSLAVNAAAMGVTAKGIFKKIKVGGLLKSGGGRKKLLLLVIPVILLVLFGVFYVFGRSATVTLGINGEEIEGSENVTLSESKSTSATDNILNVKFITSSQDGKVTTAATGKKETGDKAKGTVTIFNNDTTGKTLPAGTVIVSENNLKFLTDKAVTVASASGDIFSGTEPGKVDVTVTAEKFGTNYNFPSDTKFKVEGSSTVAAKNDKAFAGGTKKDIKVVSQKDLDKLAKDLQKQLEGEAKSDIQKQATGDSVISPNFTSVEFDKETYSKKVDDEANEVSLTGVVVYEGVAYKKSDLVNFAKEKLSEDIEDNMTLDEDRISGEAEDITQKNGVTTAKVNIKAVKIPKINTTDIAKQISGKNVKTTTRELQNIPEVEKVNIEVFINLPFLPQILPFSSDKIKIVVDKNG